jgi:hypothetical protein
MLAVDDGDDLAVGVLVGLGRTDEDAAGQSRGLG